MLRSIQFLRMHFLHMFLHVIENITNEKLMQQSFIYGGGGIQLTLTLKLSKPIGFLIVMSIFHLV